MSTFAKCEVKLKVRITFVQARAIWGAGGGGMAPSPIIFKAKVLYDYREE